MGTPKEAVWDALIVGGGPAGLAAGMYLARAGWSAVLIEAGRLGGQAGLLERVENYPGFPAGIAGGKLMERFVRHARRWGLQTVRARAERIARGRRVFRVATDRGDYRARAVIACPGAPFRGLAGLSGQGVGHAAFERAASFAGRRVAVVGGGDAAVHQALLLSRRAERVSLVHRGRRLSAIPLLLRRLERRANVELLLNTSVRGVARGPGRRLRAVRIESACGAKASLEVDALFVLIGKSPPRRLTRWRADPPGHFVAGDGRPGALRQVSIAAADGLRAAMECERHLARACG